MDFKTYCETLDLEQLRELNRHVCNRINDLHRQRQQAAAAKFSEGDLVEWTSEKHRRVVRGKIKSINGKTLTVVEEGLVATRWRVSPSMCRLVKPSETAIGIPGGHMTEPMTEAAPTMPEPAAPSTVPSGFAGSW